MAGTADHFDWVSHQWKMNVISHSENLSSCSGKCSRRFSAENWLFKFWRYSGYILQARWTDLEPSSTKFLQDSVHQKFQIGLFLTELYKKYKIKRRCYFRPHYHSADKYRIHSATQIYRLCFQRRPICFSHMYCRFLQPNEIPFYFISL